MITPREIEQLTTRSTWCQLETWRRFVKPKTPETLRVEDVVAETDGPFTALEIATKAGVTKCNDILRQMTNAKVIRKCGKRPARKGHPKQLWERVE